jgi:AsmA protein
VQGSGQIDLPKRTIDYRLEPKAAPTLKGQGGKQEVAGILVPVIIRGPWDDPKFTPDLSGAVESALKNPEAVQQQLQQLDDQAKDVKRALKDAVKKKGGTEGLVQDLGKALGGEQQAPAGEGATNDQGNKPEEQVQKLLKGLLGK